MRIQPVLSTRYESQAVTSLPLQPMRVTLPRDLPDAYAIDWRQRLDQAFVSQVSEAGADAAGQHPHERPIFCGYSGSTARER